MHLPHFEHLAPKTIDEACSLLASHGKRAVAFAGGTDLLIKLKQRKLVPQYVVNLKGIPDLDYITYDENSGLRIGALTTIQSLKNSVTVKRRCNILEQAAGAEASVQIRNIATIGGNIVNASPAADAPLALMASAASLMVVGVGSQREISLEDFFVAPGKTVLQPGELVKEVRVPPVLPRTGAIYLKHALRRTDIAIVSVAVVLTLRDKICSDIKIGLGAVAPTIVRIRKAEALLLGRTITDDAANEAAQVAAQEASPIDDIRRSAKYRTRSITEVAKLAIIQAMKNAQSEGF
jgi:carbon-monoxide dehydrogenase medium subunit